MRGQMLTISEEMAGNFKEGPVLNKDCKISVANSVLHILSDVGEDTTRDGLRNTPDRVARAYDELLIGYTVDPWNLTKSSLFSDRFSTIQTTAIYSSNTE